VITKESEQPSSAYDTKTFPTTLIDPEYLLGPSNMLDTQQFRPCTVNMIEDILSELKDNKTRTKFLHSTNEDESEEIKLLEYLSKDKDKNVVLKFPCISSNQRPPALDHPDYKGSNFILKKEWENGELPTDLKFKARDDTVTCEIFGK
jgi:hypothetical protein